MPSLNTLSNIRTIFKQYVKVNLGSSGTGDDTMINQLLSDTQIWLSGEFDWKELKDRWDVGVGAQQQYLSFPSIDIYGRVASMNFQRPWNLETFWTNVYLPVGYGIGAPEYNILNANLQQFLDPVQKWEEVEQFGIPVPDALTLLAGAVGVVNGVYLYKVLFTTSFNGGSSISGPVSNSATITVVSKQVGITVPVDNTNVATGRLIYRTVAGGSTYKLLTTITDNTTTSYTDNTADGSLGANLDTSVLVSTVRKFEVWPVPASAQVLRFTGQRLPVTFTSDNDQADLDDQMIALFAAANYLDSIGDTVGSRSKLALATNRISYIRQTAPQRTLRLVFGGSVESNRGWLPIGTIASQTSNLNH